MITGHPGYQISNKNDPVLEPLAAMSYMGVPLFDTDGQIMGHLAVLDDAPMSGNESVTAIFNIFANRAAAELRRLRRDRALRERKQKLSRLFDGAMDAIVEFDSNFRITNLNAAARRVFGRPASEAVARASHRAERAIVYLYLGLGVATALRRAFLRNDRGFIPNSA